MKTRLLVVTIAFLAGACADGRVLGIGGRPEPVNDSANAPARLHVAVEYLDSKQDLFQVAPPGCADVTAMLWPGTDAQRRQRILVGDTMRVFGQLFHLKAQPGGTEWRLDARLPMDPATFAANPLTVVPPVLQGATPAYGPVSWYPVGRAASADMTVRRGADLTLALIAPEGTSDPRPPHQSWNLDVRSGGREIIAYMGGGAPPADLTVPAVYLRRAPTSELTIRLMQSAYRDTITNASYEITPVLSTVLAWKVVLID